MDDPQTWRIINILLGSVLGLVTLIVAYVWHKLENVTAKVHQMEVDAAGSVVTKPMLDRAFEEFARNYITPLNKDIGKVLHALSAQGIHVDHTR